VRLKEVKTSLTTHKDEQVLLARPTWTQARVQASAVWAETPTATTSAKMKKKRGLASMMIGKKIVGWSDDRCPLPSSFLFPDYTP
jgi:hypothetical protein